MFRQVWPSRPSFFGTFAFLFNLTGQPASPILVVVTEANRTLGQQVVAKFMGEAALLGVADKNDRHRMVLHCTLCRRHIFKSGCRQTAPRDQTTIVAMF